MTRFDVYGLKVAAHGDAAEALEALALDYAWFADGTDAGSADVELVLERRVPDLDSYGDLPASFLTPRGAVYRTGDRIVVDHFSRAASFVDRGGDRLVAQGHDAAAVHDAAYYFLLGRIGEHLDRRGLRRVHALGLSGPAGGTLVLLPTGGGKSTLALAALDDDRVRLLSEDSPLLDAAGRLHPFPLRIGITQEAGQNGDGTRLIERLGGRPKLALEVSRFEHRIEAGSRPLRHLVLGGRSLGRAARLDPLPQRAALAPLLHGAVAGVGLYQGFGFAHQRGAGAVGAKLALAAARAATCASALRGVKVWRLTLGRDRDRNWETLRELVGGDTAS